MNTSFNFERKQILAAQNETPWDLGNSFLYRMCSEYPHHKNDKEIIAKIWLIGRSYAAAIERRKVKNSTDQVNDDFYVNSVAPMIRESSIDEWFSMLSHEETPSLENIDSILSVHYHLTELFFQITGLQKRSLASKYLHFHFPNLYFIYDSRSSAAISKVIRGTIYQYSGVDQTYSVFYQKCLHLVTDIHSKNKILISPRQLDNLLLNI